MKYDKASYSPWPAGPVTIIDILPASSFPASSDIATQSDEEMGPWFSPHDRWVASFLRRCGKAANSCLPAKEDPSSTPMMVNGPVSYGRGGEVMCGTWNDTWKIWHEAFCHALCPSLFLLYVMHQETLISTKAFRNLLELVSVTNFGCLPLNFPCKSLCSRIATLRSVRMSWEIVLKPVSLCCHSLCQIYIHSFFCTKTVLCWFPNAENRGKLLDEGDTDHIREWASK